MGSGVAVAAVALGASVVEKHFTLARADGGVDSAFSLEPAELARLVTDTERVWQSLGRVRYGPTEAEHKSLVFRRPIYASADIKAGYHFTSLNIRIVRPGDGAPLSFLPALLWKKACIDYPMGSPVKLSSLIQ